MKYLIETIEDIESAYIINDKNEFISNIKFSDIRDKLTNCYYPYELKNLNDDISNKILIDWEEFIPKYELHFIDFSYEILSKTMNEREFEFEICKIVNSKEISYIRVFDEDIYYSNNEMNQKLELKNIISNIDKAFNKLRLLETNNYQNIVNKQFSKSYINVLDHITSKYSDVFPDYIKKFEFQIDEIKRKYQLDFEDIGDLSYFVYVEEQSKFKQFEKTLISKGYLNQQLVWIGAKNDLVRFYNSLKTKGLFMQTQKKAVLKSLQERYSIDIGKFDQPARIEKITDPNSKFSFLN